MSVLACDRNGCEHIMCDRLILNHTMYICNSCFDELVVYKKTWPLTMKPNEVKKRIIEFMNTEPREYGEALNVDEEFDRLTRDDI